MKIRAATELALALSLGLTFAACGQEPASHYAAGAKTYGAPKDSDAIVSEGEEDDDPIVFPTPAREPQQPFQQAPIPAPAPSEEPAPAPAPAAAPGPAAPGAPATEPSAPPPPPPPPPPAPIPVPEPASDDDDDDTVIEDDPEEEEETPRLDPDSLIKSLWLQSYFDTSSVAGMKNDRGYKSLGLLQSRVEAQLTSAPTDGMKLTQTFGDGIARSIAAQDISNAAGDANRVEGQPTASLLQSLYRLNSALCPGVFLCIEKMTAEPVEGASQTVCFKDPATGLAKPFPYGAPPNYKEVDYDAFYGDYGPWTVEAYAGAAVDCANPGAAPIAVEMLATTISKVDVATIPYLLHTINPTPATFAVKFDRHRLAGDMNAPYADETVFLNKATTYAMDEAKAELVQLIVTKRQTIDVAAQAGGGLFGGIADLLAGIDGIQVDVHFELCQNLLKPEEPSHCPAESP